MYDPTMPITFQNVPTYEEGGVTFVTSEAGAILPQQVAERHSDLLARLA